MMGKKTHDNTPNFDRDLLPEYEFDYSQAKPNRFAQKNLRQSQTVVGLGDEVSPIFQTSESVNSQYPGGLDE